MLANLLKATAMVRLHCLRVEANLLQKPFGIVNHVEPKQLISIQLAHVSSILPFCP